MQSKKENATGFQTLETLRQATALLEATKITLVFKLNKVSAMCKIKGRSYGGSANTQEAAFEALKNNVVSNLIIVNN